MSTLITRSIKPLFKSYSISGLSIGIFGIGCYILGRSHQRQFPPVLYNLTEAERQQVWKGYLDAEMRAAQEALIEFPLLSPLAEHEAEQFQQQDKKRLTLRQQLKEKYTQAVLNDHGLSFSQFSEIEVESRLKRWHAPIEAA